MKKNFVLQLEKLYTLIYPILISVRMYATTIAIECYFLKGHFGDFAWRNANNLVTRYALATSRRKVSYGIF